MTDRDELDEILDRIASGNATESDLHTFQKLVQVGKYNINIEQGQNVQIGDHIYYGADAEAIQQALRSVLQEQNRVDRPRNEKLLLRAVRQEVAARLKQSLHNAVLINLGKKLQPERVKRPWDTQIKIGLKPTEAIADATTIVQVFDREEVAGRLLILGNPGSGKTTTQLDLAKALIERAEQHPDEPIPILLNLSSWKDDRLSMREWLVAELKSKYGVSPEVSRKWLSRHQLLPMLDGLDEVEPQRQELCVKAIDWLLAEGKPPYLVVCSRSEEYANYNTPLQLNGAVYLQALSEAQIQSYLVAIDRAELWHTICQDSEMLELVRAPLLLSIAILADEEVIPEQWQRLNLFEDRLQYLLDVYIRRMLALKLNNNPSTKQKASYTIQTRRQLVWLAQQLQKGFQTEFLIERMQPTLLETENRKWLYQVWVKVTVGLILSIVYSLDIWITEGLGIGFLAISLMIWMVANSLSTISDKMLDELLSGAIIAGVICSTVFPLRVEWLSILVVVILLLKNKLTGFWGGEIEPTETLRLNFKDARREIFLCLLGGTSIGVVTGAILTAVSSWKVGLGMGLSCGIGGSLMFVIAFGLSGTLIGSNIEIRTRPNQGIWRSLTSAGGSALLFGSMTGLALVLLLGPMMIGGLDEWNQLKLALDLKFDPALLEKLSRVRIRNPNNTWIEAVFGLLEKSTGALLIQAISLFVKITYPLFTAALLGVGAVSGLIHGGIACIRHFTLRVLLYREGEIPWNCARFLDDCTDRLLLQRVGGRYRFIHRLLQEHFAAMSIEGEKARE